MRKRLGAIKPLRAVIEAMLSYIVRLQKQIQQMGAVAVGPKQFPEVYALGEDCARRLGIGVPQIFVFYSPILNAYTLAAEDNAPIIVVSSALVKAYTPDELKFVIGHECGHIHNLHGVYNTLVVILTNVLVSELLNLVNGVSFGVF